MAIDMQSAELLNIHTRRVEAPTIHVAVETHARPELDEVLPGDHRCPSHQRRRHRRA